MNYGDIFGYQIDSNSKKWSGGQTVANFMAQDLGTATKIDPVAHFSGVGSEATKVKSSPETEIKV